jgi:hypothetical protein
MKPNPILLSVSALALAFALAAPTLRAEEAAGGAAPAPAPAPAPKHEKMKGGKVKGEKVVGALEKVDATAKTVTISGKTYKVADAAKIRVDGAEKGLADLQAGDSVTLKYTTEADGTLIAQGILKGEVVKKGGKKK